MVHVARQVQQKLNTPTPWRSIGKSWEAKDLLILPLRTQNKDNKMSWFNPNQCSYKKCSTRRKGQNVMTDELENSVLFIISKVTNLKHLNHQANKILYHGVSPRLPTGRSAWSTWRLKHPTPEIDIDLWLADKSGIVYPIWTSCNSSVTWQTWAASSPPKKSYGSGSTFFFDRLRSLSFTYTSSVFDYYQRQRIW